jgi:hypothetical protein
MVSISTPKVGRWLLARYRNVNRGTKLTVSKSVPPVFETLGLKCFQPAPVMSQKKYGRNATWEVDRLRGARLSLIGLRYLLQEIHMPAFSFYPVVP